MRDGAAWIMLFVGALAIGPGWGKAYDALAEDVSEWSDTVGCWVD
jgi:hypothetical protein